MAVISFDTLKHVERLTAAGVPDAQARAEASALRDVLAESLDTTIATKGDIARLEASTKADVREVREEVRELKAGLKNDIARLEANTKADIARLEAGTKADIGLMRKDMELMHKDMDLIRKDMQAMELRLVMKLGAIMATIMGIGIAVLRMAH